MNSEPLKVNIEKGVARRCCFVLAYCLLLFTIHCSLFTAASAQDDPPESAPPPLKTISREERSRLDAEPDVKDRTRLSLELMESRLMTAEKSASGQDFDGMFRELGIFHGLMENSLEFLNKNDDGRGRVLDSFKRLEIAFRKFAPRIETVRRETPLKYEEYIIGLLRSLRDARARAMDPLFGNTVMPNQ